MGRVIIIYLVLAMVAKFSDSTLRSSGPNSICERVFSVQVSQNVPYVETYKQLVIGIFYKIKTRINYRVEYRTIWHSEQKCCPGYYEFNSECKPLCNSSCENGFCYQPNECRCNPDYRKDKNNNNHCVPVCKNECIEGTCTKPNICTCNSGYSLLPDGFTCTPKCNSCPENSVCTAPNVCECTSNYYLKTKNNSSKEIICAPICDIPCGNSDCVAPDVCKCREGYEDLYGDAFYCTPKCSLPCKFGTCTAPEVCTCNHGYSRPLNGSTCQPICNRNCINGACIAPNLCSCSDGYGFMDDSESICEPICETACENGQCTAPQICTCNAGYQMNNESKCDPVCTQPCHNAECTAPEFCTCLNGFSKTDNFTCEPVCNSTCETGRCTAPQVCTCNKGNQMNNNSICEPICTQKCYNGECTAPEYCTCFNGYDKTDNFTNLCEPVCNSTCENGRCTAPDECTCDKGFEKEFDECVPECQCIHGSCTGKNRTCVCEKSYELSGGENSTICVPVCDQGCVNADCILPNECKCHDNYIMNNGTDNIKACVSVCGVECVHGLCLPEEKACSCFYGWTGSSCEVALICRAVFDANKFEGELFNGFSYANETENMPKMESRWKGPVCEEYCFPINMNQTECFNNLMTAENSTTVSCFLNMDLDCNSVNSQHSKTKSDSIISSGIMNTIYAVIGGIIVVLVFLLIRKYKRNKKPIVNTVVCRSDSFQCATDCLLEEEGTSL